jgi:hypothetical protein
MGFVVDEKYIHYVASVFNAQNEGIDVDYVKEHETEKLTITLHQPIPFESRLRIYKGNVSGQLRNIEWSYNPLKAKSLPSKVDQQELEVRALEMFRSLPIHFQDSVLKRVIKDF